MRLLGIDYGRKRIGLAVCDALGITVTPIKVVHRKNMEYDLGEIKKTVLEKEPEMLIIGYPLNMDGTPGLLTEEIKDFGERLKAVVNLPIDYIDERLTTHEAERFLIEEADISREKRKNVKDKLAACLILQTYLDRQK